MGPLGLLSLIACFLAGAWLALRPRTALGIAGSALLTLPLVAFAVTVPNAFVDGTVADADEVNANFSALAAAVAQVTIPHTFTNGTVADADEVNANFSALATAIEGLQNPTCGNEVTEPSNGEQCDDGNSIDVDGCRNNCQLPSCGDGVQSQTEICDTNGNSAICDYDCTFPQCGGGDGIVNFNAGEECDDDNAVAGDGCHQCQLEVCG